MSEKLLNRPCEGQSWKILADFGFKNPKFCQKRKFGQKLKICSNLENFGKKWKIENYVFEDHRKFGKKFSKIEILVKVENFVKNRIFGQKSKIWSKIENLVKSRKFCQKTKFCSKIENLVKNRKFWWKNRKFGQKSKILVKKTKFCSIIENFCKKIQILD